MASLKGKKNDDDASSQSSGSSFGADMNFKDDAGKEVHQHVHIPEAPTPTYDDEELRKLIVYIKRMTILFALDHRDWTEEAHDAIRRWLFDTNELMLTIFYDRNKLIACLGFPLVPVQDLSYFLRQTPHHIFDVECFHDEVVYGTIHEDVDGCLLKVIGYVYAPLFRNYAGWSENVRLRFSKAFDKFLAYLTGLHYKLAGMTVLYVPYVVNEINRKNAHTFKEFVRSLEGIAVDCITQIRACHSDKTLVSPNDFVFPVEEYEFWKYRYEAMNALKMQMHHVDVEKIISVLRVAQSIYIKQLDELIIECSRETEEAKSNIDYLQLLVEPCAAIDKAESPADIPELLPRIIHTFRYIWMNSKFYNRKDLISGLFRNLSNQIIKFSQEKMDVVKILNGNSRFGIKMCNMAIDCCLSYKALYNIMSKEKSTSHPDFEWVLENAMIFNHVDAFIERLNDLIDICEAMIVFGRLDETEEIAKPLFGGTRGSEYERSAEMVEEQFLENLRRLYTDAKDLILNVHKNQWYDYVLKYRQLVQNLEEVVQRLMSSVFEGICNIEEGIEALVTMQFYSYRPALRKTYLRQVVTIWEMFITEITATSKTLLDRSKDKDAFFPAKASRVMAFRTNLERLEWIKRRLDNAEWLPVVELQSIAISKFASVKKDIEEQVQAIYFDWTHSFGVEDLLLRLQRPLLNRSKERPGHLECNIDRSVLEICNEATLFEQMGFNIPTNIQRLYAKNKSLRSTYNSVMAVCLDYNHIQSALSSLERRLFKALKLSLDKKITPGFFKLTWGGELSDEYIADCVKYTGNLQESVEIYKRANECIATACEKICDTPFLVMKFPAALPLNGFARAMDRNFKKTIKFLIRQHSLIINLLIAVLYEFQPVIMEMATEWYEYVEGFDNMLAKSILICANNTLTNVCDAIKLDGTIGPTPFLKISAEIADRKVIISPDMTAISNTLESVYGRVSSALENYSRLADRFSLPNAHKVLSFKELFEKDTQGIETQKRIVFETKRCSTLMKEYLQSWIPFNFVWETTEEEFISNIKLTDQSAEMYDGLIERYSDLGNEMSNQENIVTVHFTLVHPTQLKRVALEQIDRWQDLHMQCLENIATDRLKAIYRYIEKNTKDILRIPQSLNELKISNELYKRLNREVPIKEAEFPGIDALFNILNKYKIEYPVQYKELLLNLDQEWEVYLKVLNEANEMLDTTKEEFKNELLKQAGKFREVIKVMHVEFNRKVPTTSETPSKLALKYMAIIEQKIRDCLNFEESLIRDLKILDVNHIINLDLRALQEEVKLIHGIWQLVSDWDDSWSEWRRGNFWIINVDIMEETAIEMFKEFNQLYRRYKERDWEFLETARRNVDTFRRTLPLIAALKNPCMRIRHWDRVRDTMKVEFDQNSEEFTLGLIIKLDFQKFSEDIQDISNAATMELQIENGIKNIALIWKTQTFEMSHYRDNIYRIKNVEDCFQVLEEHVVQISTMKSTRFVEPFIKEVDYWERTLSYISETLEKGLTVQRNWLYMENIFIGEDIRKQLPEEATRFDNVSKEWEVITSKMYKAITAVKATHLRPPSYLLNRFTKMEAQLELIQRALEVYLETKRQLFPRFYFISNDDLLEILGNAKRPDLVQKHLKKLFDNLCKLELLKVIGKKKEVRFQANGMYADDGEMVQFINTMYIDGPSEKWLTVVEIRMLAVLKEQLKLTRNSLRKLSSNREKWMSMWPGQMCLTTAQIQWTTDCTQSLVLCKLINQKKPLRKLKKKQNKVLMKLSEISRKELPYLQRLKVNTLITIEIHGRDVIERMYKANCKDVGHFEWFSQLRFYWNRDRELCVIRQTNTEHLYGYEYTGNSGRLVITPLTDRCYITLTTALHLHRGGSPKGPAGTGKTETVKDLGKALGLWVIVTNCSEGLDYKSIGKNFSGLAQTGAWGCFDEFNRINIEVLSVVAQQILCIIAALSAGMTQFMFEGFNIRLVHTVGLFITMNPGYAGRTELPDNLKSMFRPISMMVPDNIIIAENLLFSDGFQNARILARKVFTLYELAKQQLSKQYHYDFGLRSMVALLRYAGRKRRQLIGTNEEEVVYLAMQDMNVARFTANDLPLFIGIMADIFPGVTVPKIDYKEFRTCIMEELSSCGMQLIPIAIKKTIELYETKNSRHSVMVIGDTGTAKSVTWKCLQGAFNRMKNLKIAGWESVLVYPLNPKSLNEAELYGEYNLATGEWLDGVLSSIMRTICSDEEPVSKWLLFDGPVDAVWIENMNSVMDDNKILTLVNSERITMPPQVSLLFEVADLAVASPATVSRCGMIYNDYNDWGWRPYVNSWMARQKPKEYVNFLDEFFERFLNKVLNFKRLNCRETVATNELSNVISMCTLLESYCTKKNGIIVGDNLEFITKLWFMFCLVWSVCATVDEAGRGKIDAYIREMDGSFPVRDMVYDYFVDPEKNTFLSWETKLSDDWRYDSNAPFYKIIVPTMDTMRYEYLVSKLILAEKPVMLVGDVGTGKTSTAVSVTDAVDKSQYTLLFINISAQTTANGLQEAIENKTEKRTKVIFMPIGGKKMICFMDDFNMPAKDVYGSQPPLELIRQWLDYKFWYNRLNQQRVYIQNTLLIAAMGPPGGGRQVISPRTQSRFFVLNMTFPTDATTTRIYGTMLMQKMLDFGTEMQSIWKPITAASIDLFRGVVKRMLPTPAKTHYLFNLRDISKIFQGMLRCHPEAQQKKEDILRLWIHECFRVFCDRLVDDSDISWFTNEVNTVLGRHMETTLHSLCPNKTIPIFGDFLSALGIYSDIVNMDDLRNYLINQLQEYNEMPGATRLNLVFFKEAVEHVTRIVRVISQSRGHMLNIGIGGSGRQVLTKMAAFIAETEVFQVEVTKKYGAAEFREDLKTLYKMTGVKRRATAFLFSGEQVVESTFLVILNNMLSTGEANLFKPEEFEELKMELEKPAKKAKIPATTEAYYEFFMQNVRSLMHVCFCLSPIGEDFRVFLRQYPALINATTTDWFRNWPQEALLEVAQQFLQGFPLNLPAPGSRDSKGKKIEASGGEGGEERASARLSNFTNDQLQLAVSALFAMIHSSVAEISEVMLLEVKRHNYVTSVNYLELVSGFQDLLKAKRVEVSSSANKLRNGLWKIEDTQAKVSVMSDELVVSQEQVKVLTEQCEVFIAEIEVQSVEVNAQREKVDAESKVIGEEEVVCKELAAVAQADLDLVQPMVDAAVAALDALNKKDLTEVKSYGRPPPKIEKVMEAVMILIGKEPTWEMSKKMLGEQSFLNDLKNFDRDHVTDKTLKRIGVYTRNPELEPSKVALVSLACKSLMLWVMAIENYAKVYRIVAPKKEKLDTALRSLAEKQALLESMRMALEKLNEKLDKLQTELREKTEMLDELQARAEKLKKQLERAIILVDTLSGERQRWIDTVAFLDKSFEKLPGDCILAIAFICYLGPFDTQYREILLGRWVNSIADKKIPSTEGLKITNFLSDAVTIREWNIQGLPSDEFSTENGVLVCKGRRWPLIIDPQGQANAWIRKLEEQDLKVIDFTQSDYLKTLERSLQFGFPVLLQNVGESLDQAINPILRRNFTIQSGQTLLKFNDKYVVYKDTFRLYITTKFTNPHYPPEVSSKTTIVNFAVKLSGLEAQLLAIIVRKEKPALEEQKDELVTTIAKNKRALIDLDNEILRLLNESRGSLLEDDELFVTLQKSRQTSILVKESLSTAEITEIEIDTARQAYQPAAERAAILFFVLTDMSKIDPMYQFSLGAYVLLFTQSIARSVKHPNVAERIININNYHTYAMYKNTCRGLFERHKLLFSIHMTANILKGAGKLVEDEYNYILKGGIVLDRQGQEPNPCPNWIDDGMWDNITELDKVPGFHGIIDSFEQNSRQWQEWHSTTAPETLELVGEWNDKLSDFQKICIVRCLRVDRASFCLSSFIVSVLGSKFIEPPVLDLKTVYEESIPQTPLIFVLSPGVDPTSSLIGLAEQFNMSSRLHSLSLGQGQSPVATKLIMDGVREGHWVFLANCHLSLSWMPQLDKIIQTMQGTKLHKKFRLWLSSSPHPDFPIAILQTSIKMTTEPPRGIKANMKRLYNMLSEDNMTQCEADPGKYKKLLFALCFFHTVLIERKKFLQLGWNIVYSFNDSDFEVSEILLALYLNEYEETPWGALKYLIAGVNYGGHVTDDWDRRLLLTYINQFFCEEALFTPKYPLSSLPTYYIPHDGNHEFYVDFISMFPNFDKPEAFGQHPNADVASLIGETRLLFETLTSMQAQSTVAEGESSEDKVLRLARDIEVNLPREINYEQTSKLVGRDKKPLDVVLLQEIERYNALLNNIAVCLRDLQKGIKGLVVMSVELEDVFTAIFEGRVPAVWLKSYASLKPLASWARDLIFRIEHFAGWAKFVKPPVLFWLAAFTFPTGFLTAVLQTSARATKTPIDELSWEFYVFVEEDSAAARIKRPGGGVYVRGLFLEGAGWNRRQQCLQDPKPMELVCSMPVIHLKPVENAKKRVRGIFQCPAYYFPQRGVSYVIAVDLKTGDETSDYWVKRAAGLLLSLAS